MKRILFLIVLSFVFVACENSVTLNNSDEIQQPDKNEQQDEETQDEEVLDEETQDNMPDETADETVDSDIVWDNCSENYECEVSEMCIKKFGDCTGWGYCEQIPEACDSVEEPVCGCDDVTYSNICEANKLSRNAKHSGECQ